MLCPESEDGSVRPAMKTFPGWLGLSAVPTMARELFVMVTDDMAECQAARTKAWGCLNKGRSAQVVPSRGESFYVLMLLIHRNILQSASLGVS